MSLLIQISLKFEIRAAEDVATLADVPKVFLYVYKSGRFFTLINSFCVDGRNYICIFGGIHLSDAAIDENSNN